MDSTKPHVKNVRVKLFLQRLRESGALIWIVLVKYRIPDVAGAACVSRASAIKSQFTLARKPLHMHYDSTPVMSWLEFGSGVEAPVDGVEEQVGQREGQARVRVDHVAVADQQVNVFTHRSLPAEASPLWETEFLILCRCGEGLRGQGRCQPGEWSQLNVVVMETAVKRHRLAGVEGGWQLERSRQYFIVLDVDALRQPTANCMELNPV